MPIKTRVTEMLNIDHPVVMVSPTLAPTSISPSLWPLKSSSTPPLSANKKRHLCCAFRGDDGYWPAGTCCCRLTRRWAGHRCNPQLGTTEEAAARASERLANCARGNHSGVNLTILPAARPPLRYVHARHGRRGGKSSRNCKCFRYFTHQDSLTSSPRIFHVWAPFQRPVLIRPNMCSFSSMAWSPFTSAPRSATH